MAEQKFQDLTIKNNFMFGAVMAQPETCKGVIELVLGMKIDHVEVSKEKSMVYHPEYKGVRLDVYAKDENNTRYNIEMQVAKKPALGKRTRYYQGQMDMELLLSGHEYKELPNSYVIFICDFDPFGKRKY
ncbi:Rpn family recombination-promoting nuclease/putative transposase, partial [Blautia sp.]|uniref:Rpn family recombination-promoting nuclease/putative transposase n=1 Tax=Blautia sp. TaxID=1955243 RepID=UPI00263A3B63